jgi:glycerol-3-phosphate dehydrogenase
VTPEDVVWSYAGVRPLVDDGSGRPEAASRGYRFDIDTDNDGQVPLLSVFGGKITTYRHLAQGAVAELAKWLPILGGRGWTAEAALPGGDFSADAVAGQRNALAQDYPFLDDATVRRLVRSYGTLARTWLGEAKAITDLGIDFGHGLSEAEIRYLMGREWARSAEDILWRRSKLGLRFSASETAKLESFIARK